MHLKVWKSYKQTDISIFRGAIMENSNLPSKQDVVFFFGAGASVDAGIPDTYSFAEVFERLSKNTMLGYILIF